MGLFDMSSRGLLLGLSRCCHHCHHFDSQFLISRATLHRSLSRTSFTPARPRQSRTYARQSASKPSNQQPRVLEKPTRFNPPSHGARRLRPTPNYPGPRLSDAEVAARRTRRYPNMMPAEGTWMFWFLTNRRIHVWFTLSVLTGLAGISIFHSFLTSTAFREDLPSPVDFINHPLGAPAQFLHVYKKHVEYESLKVADKRAAKISDSKKRQEFLMEHGVEPGFLTGRWMGKLGTIEGDKFREELAAKEAAEGAMKNQGSGAGGAGGPGDAVVVVAAAEDAETQQQRQQEQSVGQKRKVKKWFGIWE